MSRYQKMAILNEAYTRAKRKGDTNMQKVISEKLKNLFKEGKK